MSKNSRVVSIVRAGFTVEGRVGPFFLEMIRTGTPTATEYAGTIRHNRKNNIMILSILYYTTNKMKDKLVSVLHQRKENTIHLSHLYGAAFTVGWGHFLNSLSTCIYNIFIYIMNTSFPGIVFVHH